jgi:hypothetical protein
MVPKLQEILTQHREAGHKEKLHICVPSRDGVFGVSSHFGSVLSLHYCITDKKD